MATDVTAGSMAHPRRDERDAGSRDAGTVEPRWSEYVKFLAAAGAIAGALVGGPLVGIVGFSLLVALFGWLVGALAP